MRLLLKIILGIFFPYCPMCEGRGWNQYIWPGLLSEREVCPMCKGLKRLRFINDSD